MSLDLYLEETRPEEVFWTNMTHNVCSMMHEAGVYEALWRGTGTKAKDHIQTLEQGIELMKSDPDRFRKFDAANGWGTYDQALPWLEGVLKAFKESPEAELRCSV